MKIAVPLHQDKLSSHFGQASQFAIFTLSNQKEVLGLEKLTPPPHEPGAYPRWLAQLGVSVLLAGGMGGRALTLFRQAQIEVYGNLSSNLTPQEALDLYLKNSLSKESDPTCNNNHHGHGHNKNCGSGED